jgi:Flp pilus assembly protein TadG
VLTSPCGSEYRATPRERKTSCFQSSRHRAQRGSAIIETGLILPLLILMACGVMDLARVFFAGIVVESAARAGVQVASFSVGNAGAIGATDTAAQNDASGQGLTGITTTSRTFCGCNTSNTEVSCSTATCSGNTPSGYVETIASYTFVPILPYPGIPGNIALTSTVKFRVQ